MNEKGQTLVEALLAVAFAVVVVVALVGVGITAMRTANYGKNQAEATRLSTEALELLRSQRDSSAWTIFSNTAETCGFTSNAGCCISITGLTPTSNVATCTVAGIYYRYVKATTVDTASTPQVVYEAHTVYTEGLVSRDVKLVQTFTNWH